MNRPHTWLIYGAAGYTGSLIARHALEQGHRPVLSGRNAPAVKAVAEQLDLPSRIVSLDDPVALQSALEGVDLVLNAAGPFLHTAAPLAEACLDARVHYLDVGNEMQVFGHLYDLDDRAQRSEVAIIPGVGFGVVATNCLARHVSDVLGGAVDLEVGTRAATAKQGPGIAASIRESLPFGGWTRREGRLHAHQLGSGGTTVEFPDGTCRVMPFPTGDLEAAFQATRAVNITAYAAVPDPDAVGDAADTDPSAPQAYRSYGWARAVGADGATAEAWLQTGDSYAFTAAASVRAVEETLSRSACGALSPAAAFGTDFAFTIRDTRRVDSIERVTVALTSAAMVRP